MEARAILFSENVLDIQNENGTISKAIVNPVYFFAPAFIPTVYSFSVMIVLEETELKNNYAVEIELLSPNCSQSVFKANANIDAKKNIVEPIKHKASLNLHLAMQNVKIEAEGDYSLIVRINGEEIGKEIVSFYKQ